MANKLLTLPFIAASEVEAELRRIATEATENLVISDHARMRMIERDITLGQIVKTIKAGGMICAPSWCAEKEKGWRCTFERINAGVKVTVVAKLIKQNENLCLIVTSWEN